MTREHTKPKPYWLGVLSNAGRGLSPFGNGTLSYAGVMFETHPGSTQYLTDAQAERVRGRVAQGIVRLVRHPKGVGVRFERWPKDSPSYRPEPGDVPLGKFLFMHELGEDEVRPERASPMVVEGADT